MKHLAITPTRGIMDSPHARLGGRIFNLRRWFDFTVSDAQRICAKRSLLHGLAPRRACGNHGNVIGSALHYEKSSCLPEVQRNQVDQGERAVP